MKNVIILFLVVAPYYLVAQKDQIESLIKSYPNEDVVETINKVEFDISIQEDTLLIIENEYLERAYLTENATHYSKDYVFTSSFHEILKLEANTVILNGRKSKKIAVEDFLVQELGDNFHDDSQKMNFVYPNLEAGVKTELIREELHKNPRLLPAFFFGGYFPTQKAQFTVTVDNDVEIDFVSFNTEELSLTKSIDEKRSRTTYTFEAINVKAYDFEAQAPDFRFYGPHIYPIIKSYQSKAGIKEISGSTRLLYNWYSSLVSGVNQEEASVEIKAIVDEIVAAANSEEEIVKSIFYWVQDNIKYIAFEYGLGGFIPRNANDICEKKFGDCKDNTSLMKEMLSLAGIESFYTWIGTTDIPYTYEQLPTAATDNHMILSYKDPDGAIVFLDGTAQHLQYGMPTGFIQGKQALIGINEDNYELATVPIIEAKQNSEVDSSFIIIAQNRIKGTTSKKFNGFKKYEVLNSLTNKNQSQKESYYKNLLNKGNNKFYYSNLNELNMNNIDQSLEFNYDFETQDYIVEIGEEIYLNLNLDRPIDHYLIPEVRTADIVQDYKSSYNYYIELSIKPDQELTYIPEPFELKDELLDFKIEYKLEGNILKYQQNLEINFITLKQKDQDRFRGLSKQITKALKENIIIKKKS